MVIAPAEQLDETALSAWRAYLTSHAAILRALDAELRAVHGLTSRDFEVLRYLAQAPDRRLPMTSLAASTKLTRSGVTRLVDGLVTDGLIERVSCPEDGRVCFARLTDQGLDRLRSAGRTHMSAIRHLFLEHFSHREIDQLAGLLERLPGGQSEGTCAVS